MQHKNLRKSKFTCRLVCEQECVEHPTLLVVHRASMTGLSLLVFEQHSFLVLVAHSGTIFRPISARCGLRACKTQVHPDVADQL